MAVDAGGGAALPVNKLSHWQDVRDQVVVLALQGGFAGPYGELNPEAVAAAYAAAMESLTAAAAAPAASAPASSSTGNGGGAAPSAGTRPPSLAHLLTQASC